jgi:hypothetical protein
MRPRWMTRAPPSASTYLTPPLPLILLFRCCATSFQRSLLGDIVDVDDCFSQKCQELRDLFEGAESADAAALFEGRQLLAVLQRWSVLNYLAVLKIVKKHDKSGRLRPLRKEVVSALSRASFVAALQTPALFSDISGSQLTDSAPAARDRRTRETDGGNSSSADERLDGDECRSSRWSTTQPGGSSVHRTRLSSERNVRTTRPSSEGDEGETAEERELRRLAKLEALAEHSKSLEYLLSVPLVLPNSTQKHCHEHTTALLRTVAVDKCAA